MIGSSHYHLLPFASAGVSWIADMIINILQSVEFFIDKKTIMNQKTPNKH